MKRTFLAAALALSLAAQAPAQSRSTGDNMTLTAIDGIKVGHFTLAERPTGCTVVLIESGATGGVEVSGGALRRRRSWQPVGQGEEVPDGDDANALITSHRQQVALVAEELRQGLAAAGALGDDEDAA